MCVCVCVLCILSDDPAQACFVGGQKYVHVLENLRSAKFHFLRMSNTDFCVSILNAMSMT